jgi:hypothetical protein
MTAATSSVVAVRPTGMSAASLASCSSLEPTRMLAISRASFLEDEVRRGEIRRKVLSTVFCDGLEDQWLDSPGQKSSSDDDLT